MTRTTVADDDREALTTDDGGAPLAPGDRPGPSEPAQPAPMKVLAGRYRIRRRIAAGGMGIVYEADDLLVGERVALKAIRPEHARDPGAAARFRRELQLARRVTHPGVCRIFDVAIDGDTPFLTMELIDGASLAARLERGRLSCAEALPILTQVGAALDAAHAAGVIHRDLKSANILIDGGRPATPQAEPPYDRPRGPASAPERAVITDFGIARALDAGAATVTGDAGLVGTPAYMAPEQIAGLAPTPAVDIYALGVVAFEMITGRLPFEGPTPLAIAAARLTSEPPRPRALVPDLDPRWDAAIRRCSHV